MAVQPTGTVTLLFSDIEGSTSMLEQLGPERYAEVLEVNPSRIRDAQRSRLCGTFIGNSRPSLPCVLRVLPSAGAGFSTRGGLSA